MDKTKAWILSLDKIEYKEAFDLQRKLVEKRMEGKIPDVFILLEHYPVFTVSRDETRNNILVSEEVLKKKGVDVCRTDRGGDVTYHGPGQIVGYNIMDLGCRGKDLHVYIRSIEQLIIDTLSDYDISAGRDTKHPGVWVDNNKIAAIGIAIKSGWISMHGFSLNVNPDMECYSMIVPCGIADKGVTCMKEVCGSDIMIEELHQKLIEHYCRIFIMNPEIITLGDLKWL